MKRMSMIGVVALGVTLIWACSSVVEELVLTPDASAEDKPRESTTLEVECRNDWYRQTTSPSVMRTEFWYAELDLERFPARGISAFTCGRVQQFDPDDYEGDAFGACQSDSECEHNIDTMDGLNPLDCISTQVTFDANVARVFCGKSAYVDGHVNPLLSDRFRFSRATFVVH